MKVWQYTLNDNMHTVDYATRQPISTNIILLRELRSVEEVEHNTLLKVVAVEEIEVNDGYACIPYIPICYN